MIAHCQDCGHPHGRSCLACEDAAQVGCLAPCAVHPACPHEPNARGTACEHCGLTAERVTPDELYDAFLAEIETLRLAALGQTSWIGEEANR